MILNKRYLLGTILKKLDIFNTLSPQTIFITIAIQKPIIALENHFPGLPVIIMHKAQKTINRVVISGRKLCKESKAASALDANHLPNNSPIKLDNGLSNFIVYNPFKNS